MTLKVGNNVNDKKKHVILVNSLYIASTRQITNKQHRKVVPLPIVSYYSNETDRLTPVKYFWMSQSISYQMAKCKNLEKSQDSFIHNLQE